MGISLGKVNYCLKKLIEKGFVKFNNFSRNPNKVGYKYLLTPMGIEQKAQLTLEFLSIKINEYEILKQEIDKLQQDTNNFTKKNNV